MTAAARLLETARAAGLSFEVDGDRLVVEIDSEPPPELLAELRAHKPELIAILRPAPSDNLAERAALVEYGAGVPRGWAEGFAALCTMPAPTGFSSERWARIVDAAGVFIDKWASKAAELGWSDLDVFGCDPDRPAARFDAMGIVPLLERCEVIGLDENGADLLSRVGEVRQRYRRRPISPHAVPLWDLVHR
jgi:hypothetical protein